MKTNEFRYLLHSLYRGTLPGVPVNNFYPDELIYLLHSILHTVRSAAKAGYDHCKFSCKGCGIDHKTSGDIINILYYDYQLHAEVNADVLTISGWDKL